MNLRTRNNLIAIFCFGPIAVTLLPWGVLLLPIWIVGLVNDLSGNPMGVGYGPEETIWVSIYPIACLLLGIAGLVGLFRVLSIANAPDSPVRGRRLTQVLVTCGVVSVVIFNGGGGGIISPFEAAVPAMIYWVLPLVGTVYFLFVARRRLFGFADATN